MNSPKVSIIVPIYGVEKYIEKCAISLFEQTYSNVEYVFVDDCTMDKSIEILNEVIRRYPIRIPTVRILHHSKNRGLSAARNTGIDASSGDYVLHVDSDDYIDKTTVEICVEKALETEADIVLFGTNYQYDNFCRVVLPNLPPKNLEEFRKDLILGNVQHSIWGKLFKRELYIKNDIKAIEGLHQGEDYAVITRLAYFAQSISIIQHPLYNYLVRTNIYTFNERNVRDVYNSWQVVYDFYKNKTDYTVYADALRQRLLSFYSWQICSWQYSCHQDLSGSTLIKKFFPKSDSLNGLAFRKRVVIILFEKGWFRILHSYVLCSRKVQLLLSRRGNDIKNT